MAKATRIKVTLPDGAVIEARGKTKRGRKWLADLLHDIGVHVVPTVTESVDSDVRLRVVPIEPGTYGPYRPAVFSNDEAPAVNIAFELARERRRQTDDEGWSRRNDDTQRRDGELARAAASYCIADLPDFDEVSASLWPFAPNTINAKEHRRNLVRAGALIIAEIERVDRAAAVMRVDEIVGFPDDDFDEPAADDMCRHED